MFVSEKNTIFNQNSYASILHHNIRNLHHTIGIVYSDRVKQLQPSDFHSLNSNF